MEHSLGVKVFLFFPSSLPSCKSCIFLNTLSPVLSTPLSYVCCVCMDRLMANFADTCTSDNKGLLLLLSQNELMQVYTFNINILYYYSTRSGISIVLCNPLEDITYMMHCCVCH